MTATIGHVGERLDLLVRRGATFGPVRVTLKNPDGSPVDLTGSTLRGQIRRKALDSIVVAEFTTSLVDAAAGVASFSLAPADTSSVVTGERPSDPESRFEWDLQWTDALGGVHSLLWGQAVIHREVTRAAV